MAIIKMISNKNQSNGGMKFLLAYATDRKKTEMENGRILVSGINCSPSFAYNGIVNICTVIKYTKFPISYF